MLELILCCPKCKGDLSKKKTEYWCRKCQKRYPIIFGIPDFRLLPDPYLSSKREKEVVAKLIRQYRRSDYNQLVSQSIGKKNKDLEKQHLKFNLEIDKRGLRRKEWIIVAAKRVGREIKKNGIGLELGCGMGGTTNALRGLVKTIVGTDVSLRNLIIAKKYNEEFLNGRAVFVCASSEYLPFKTNTFALINANDVIEHVVDAYRFLKEAKRTLAQKGIFYFNSVNRYNLLERHVNVYFVGYLPRKWAGSYVKRITGVGYIGKKPLSYLELRYYLNNIFKKKGWILMPFIARNQPACGIQSGYKVILKKIADRFPESLVNFLINNNFLVKFFQSDHKMVAYKVKPENK